MTSSQLKKWREKNGYTQEDLAALLKVHVLTVTRWETGTRAVPSFLELALRTIDREKLAKKK